MTSEHCGGTAPARGSRFLKPSKPPAERKAKTGFRMESAVLCQFLLGQCLSRNVHVSRPVFATDVITSSITGLSVRSSAGPMTVLPCDALILTAGIAPEPGVSVTTGCHPIFTTDDDARFSPEIFSRAGGDIYLAGLNTTAVPVPDLASEVQLDPASIEVLMRTARKLLGDNEVDVLGSATV
ncbi:hypothetical protein EDB87DRAFT_1575012 [Lactarius vividus]|nr:hypothetical protein EDB87DRAFT_1575012 [Lactarius vividus]